MPRNFPRGLRNTPQSGPLMTGHIELRDLDLELELLKRKREMIEQQQQQLSNQSHFSSYQRQFNFNEPSQMFQAPQQQFNSSLNFGQLGQSFNRFDGKQGASLGKRSSDSNWVSSSAPKRFSGPTGGSKKKFGAGFKTRSDSLADRPAPFVNQQSPNSKQYLQNVTQTQQSQPWNQLPFYMGSKYTPPSRRFNSSKTKPTSGDFKPTKVTKSKVTSANIVDKLISYPIPKQKVIPKLVSKVAEDNFVLHAHIVPSQQLAGRLELALGNISKDIKKEYGDNDEYKASFLQHVFLREVKRAIRERLRSVMMGKHVGKVDSIVEQYRKVFPLESDKEILEVALEAQNAVKHKLLNTKLEEKDSPEIYFKENMDKLLQASLDDIFDKLLKLYGGKETLALEEAKKLYTEILEENPEDFSEDIGFKDVLENAEVVKPKEPEQSVKNAESQEKVDIDKNNEDDKNGENKTEVEAIQSDGNVTGELTVSKEETEVNTSNDANAVEGQATKPVPEHDVKRRIKKLEYMINNMIKRRLATVLPNYKNQIIKILKANENYSATEKVILARLEHKLSIEKRIAASKNKLAPVKASPATPAASTPAATSGPLYFVKIHGCPNLPRKEEMQKFLQQFKPKSVKKHKVLQLLFVGFHNKEDFDKMVAIKETIIDEKRVIFKIGDTPNTSQKLNVSVVSDDDDDVQVVNENTSANTSMDLVNSDLDGQIDDLLSSIRKEEEELTQEQSDGTVETASNKIVAVDDQPDENEGSKPKVETANDEQSEIVAPGAENKDILAANVGQSEVDIKANDVQDDVEMLTNDSVKEIAITEDDKKSEMASNKTPEKIDGEGADKVEALKSDAKSTGRATPTRASARINNATPSTIRTRRASRLAQD